MHHKPSINGSIIPSLLILLLLTPQSAADAETPIFSQAGPGSKPKKKQQGWLQQFSP